MRKITEVALPGVGVRHEFTSAVGERIAVVTHRSGRQELALYERGDPDSCKAVLHLDSDDSVSLASILGAPQVAATGAAMQRIEGLAIDWLTVAEGSAAAGATIGDGEYRSQTGSSIVAVIRNQTTYAAPGPEFELAAGDIAVSVGTPEGLTELSSLLGP